MSIKEKEGFEVISLLDNLSAGILLLDDQGKIIYINKMAAFILKIDEESASGQDFEKLNKDELVSELVNKFKIDRLPKGAEMQWGIGQNQSWVEIKINAEKDAVIIYFKNITERKEIEEKFRSAYESIRNLNFHSQKIREDERTVLSREIHDQLGQRLTGMKMEVDYILKKSSNLDDITKEKLQGVLKQIERTVSTIRNISRNLRPGILDDFGLLAALEWQADEFTKSVNIPVFFKYNGEEKPLENQKATAIFRIFQECMTNIMRHSHCTHVNVEVVFGPKALKLTVRDDGLGFDPMTLKNTKSLGILGMKERAESFAGEFTLNTAPGEGTKSILYMPY
ncbi:histidine kinase [Aquiflexum sp. LQ15W]|uniref:sensor histidine kinase n=1 Tax=Cognataquiflexum nitidum TaxID=2922272 RepID=UPI001F12FB6E|nr:histidine kinase [Cognataquiflexum nitidum]MCH6200907.1 histidine kinase [Cognataquiflexum nitidum]